MHSHQNRQLLNGQYEKWWMYFGLAHLQFKKQQAVQCLSDESVIEESGDVDLPDSCWSLQFFWLSSISVRFWVVSISPGSPDIAVINEKRRKKIFWRGFSEKATRFLISRRLFCTNTSISYYIHIYLCCLNYHMKLSEGLCSLFRPVCSLEKRIMTLRWLGFKYQIETHNKKLLSDVHLEKWNGLGI